MFIDFRTRGRETERNIDVKETQVSCFLYRPWPGTKPKPKRVPWPRIEPSTFWCTGWLQPTEPPGQGCNGLFLVFILCHTVYDSFLQLCPVGYILLVRLGPLHWVYLLYSLGLVFRNVSHRPFSPSSPQSPLPRHLLWMIPWHELEGLTVFQFQTYISTAFLPWVCGYSRDSHVAHLNDNPDRPPLLCCCFLILGPYHLVVHTRKTADSHMRVRHLWIHLAHNTVLCTCINTCLIN